MNYLRLQQLAYPRALMLDELSYLPSGPLPVPAGVSPTATTKNEQDEKNDQYGFHGATSLMKVKRLRLTWEFHTLSG